MGIRALVAVIFLSACASQGGTPAADPQAATSSPAVTTTPSTTSTTAPPLSSTPPAHECAEAPGDAFDLTDEPPVVREFVWTDTRGCIVRVDVVREGAGSAHCFRQTARVLRTGDPVGARFGYPDSPDDAVEYVRDPDETYGQPELTAGFVELEDLPPDAIDTGFRSMDRELWVSPSDPDAIYIRDLEGVERWPRGVVPLCM